MDKFVLERWAEQFRNLDKGSPVYAEAQELVRLAKLGFLMEEAIKAQVIVLEAAGKAGASAAEVRDKAILDAIKSSK